MNSYDSWRAGGDSPLGVLDYEPDYETEDDVGEMDDRSVLPVTITQFIAEAHDEQLRTLGALAAKERSERKTRLTEDYNARMRALGGKDPVETKPKRASALAVVLPDGSIKKRKPRRTAAQIAADNEAQAHNQRVADAENSATPADRALAAAAIDSDDEGVGF